MEIKEGKGVGDDEEQNKEAEERTTLKKKIDFFVLHPCLNSVLQLAVQVSLMSSAGTCL